MEREREREASDSNFKEEEGVEWTANLVLFIRSARWADGLGRLSRVAGHGAWLGAFYFVGCGIFKMNLNNF